jgi:hypothetical protein
MCVCVCVYTCAVCVVCVCVCARARVPGGSLAPPLGHFLPLGHTCWRHAFLDDTSRAQPTAARARRAAAVKALRECDRIRSAPPRSRGSGSSSATCTACSTRMRGGPTGTTSTCRRTRARPSPQWMRRTPMWSSCSGNAPPLRPAESASPAHAADHAALPSRRPEGRQRVVCPCRSAAARGSRAQVANGASDGTGAAAASSSSSSSASGSVRMVAESRQATLADALRAMVRWLCCARCGCTDKSVDLAVCEPRAPHWPRRAAVWAQPGRACRRW